MECGDLDVRGWVVSAALNGCRHQGQAYGEKGAKISVGCIDTAAVVEEDPVDNCQSESGSVKFGGEKRIENLWQQIWRYPAA